MANNNTDSGCLLGGILSAMFFWWVFSPDTFKTAFVIMVVLAVIFFILWIVVEVKNNEEKRIKAANALKKRKIERLKEENLRLSIEKKINDHKSEMAELNLYKNEKVNHLEFLKIVISQYKSALNSDQAKILRPDRYGRVKSKQSDEWKSKLLEVCCTCKLDKKNASLRTKWAQLVSMHYEVVKDSNAVVKSYLNTAISLEATLRNYLNPEDRAKATNIKNDLAKAFEELKNLQTNNVQRDYDRNEKSTLEIGIDYELECAKTLRINGWNVEDTPTSGDQGADLLAYKDELAVAIQCKNYTAKVSNSAVQEIIGAKAFYSVNNCVVVAKNGYTKSATTLAEANQVLLITEKELSNLEDYLD